MTKLVKTDREISPASDLAKRIASILSDDSAVVADKPVRVVAMPTGPRAFFQLGEHSVRLFLVELVFLRNRDRAIVMHMQIEAPSSMEFGSIVQYVMKVETTEQVSIAASVLSSAGVFDLFNRAQGAPLQCNERLYVTCVEAPTRNGKTFRRCIFRQEKSE